MTAWRSLGGWNASRVDDLSMPRDAAAWTSDSPDCRLSLVRSRKGDYTHVLLGIYRRVRNRIFRPEAPPILAAWRMSEPRCWQEPKPSMNRLKSADFNLMRVDGEDGKGRRAGLSLSHITCISSDNRSPQTGCRLSTASRCFSPKRMTVMVASIR